MIEPEEMGQDRYHLAEALRDLRKASGLSGERLAVKTHMSQSKISKIEKGKAVPSALDVERILHALDVPSNQAAELLNLAKSANAEFLSNRQSKRRGLKYRQQEIAAIEETATRIRHALPVMLTGLLQISEYLSHTSRGGGVRPRDDATRDMLVAHRLERQKVLEREDKHFTFLLTEAAVRHMLVPPLAMTRQVEHLDTLAGRPNIDIEVIPLGRQTVWIPLNVFVVYDDRLVTIETEAGAVVLRDPQDVAEHLELFEHFRLGALKHDECRELLRSIAQEFRERA